MASGSSSSTIRTRAAVGDDLGSAGLGLIDRRQLVSVVLRPLARRLAGDEVVDRLGDVGGVVADALDVLGAEQEMRAEADIARILHHVGQQLAEERGVHGVDLAVRAPHRRGLLDVALGVGVEHLLELLSTMSAMWSKPPKIFGGWIWPLDGDDALGDVLAEVADALEVVGDADGRDDLAQVQRHRLAPGDGEDGPLLDLALQRVDGAGPAR